MEQKLLANGSESAFSLEIAKWVFKLCWINAETDKYIMKPFVGCSHSDMVGPRSLREGGQQPAGKVFVIDAESQKAVLVLHRTRTQRAKFRAAQIGGLLGLPAECGEVIHKRRRGIAMGIADAMAKRVDRLPALMPDSWRKQWGRVGRLDEHVVEIGHRLRAWYQEGGASRHIADIPVVGLLTTKVAVASVSGAEKFKLGSCQGENAACSLALKPDSVVASRRHSPCYDSSSRLASGFDRGVIKRHFSPDTTPVRKEAGTGGRIRVLGISKRVNPCLPIWLIHDDRSVIPDSKQPTAWVTKLTQPQQAHVVGVALAHKMERTNSALMAREREYQSGYVNWPV